MTHFKVTFTFTFVCEPKFALSFVDQKLAIVVTPKVFSKKYSLKSKFISTINF